MSAECRTNSDLYLSTVAMRRCLKAFQFLFLIFSFITALPLIYILYLFMVIFSVPTVIILCFYWLYSGPNGYNPGFYCLCSRFLLVKFPVPTGYIPGSFWQYSRFLLVIFPVPSGNIPGSYWLYSRFLLVIFPPVPSILFRNCFTSRSLSFARLSS